MWVGKLAGEERQEKARKLDLWARWIYPALYAALLIGSMKL